ncbi:MAG: hypothetical protein V4739_15615 [Pseudomonadota bacterium]
MAFLSWSIVPRVVLVASLVSLGACGGGGDDAAPTPAASGANGSTTTAPVSAPSPALTGSVSSQMVAELPANTLCPQANGQTLVYAGVECLVVRTFGTPSSGGGDKLVVFLHGDVSAGGPADYMDTYAPAYVGPGVLTVRLLRPGYFDANGAQSTGSNGNRTDTYTPRNVQAVAYALAMLRQHHRASRLVVVGHSGGAAVAATIQGRYPGVIDAVALVACPCDLRPWRPTWTQSLSAIDYASAVPLATPVVAMTGSNDTQVPARYSATYIQALAGRGVAARQLDIPGAAHAAVELFTQPVVQAQIRALIP